MTSDAISSKESAKKRCWAAILGLGLLLISWLILNTINPNLVSLNFFESFKQTGIPGGSGGPPPPSSIPFCYVNSSGTQSYANAATCNAARTAEIATLKTQRAALGGILSSNCFQIPTGGSFNAYYFTNGPGGTVYGGPFCGAGIAFNSTIGECVDTPDPFNPGGSLNNATNSLDECNNTLNVAQTKEENKIKELNSKISSIESSSCSTSVC